MSALPWTGCCAHEAMVGCLYPLRHNQSKPFKAYEPGYVHMDVKYLPQMQDEDKRGYVFVAIDRATRWVFIAIKHHKTAASGNEFTDRLFGSRSR